MLSTRQLSSMNRLNRFLTLTLSVAGGILASACTESPTAPSRSSTSPAPSESRSAPTPANIDGVWSLDEKFILILFGAGGASTVYKCTDQGSYTFVQTGTTFTGSWVEANGLCTANDGSSFEFSGTGGVINGVISNRHLTFDTAEGCHAEATVSGAALNTMQGTAKCGSPSDGFMINSQWSATR